MMFKRLIGGIAVACGLLLGSSTEVAACATCEIFSFPGNSWYCDPVMEGETGAEFCQTVYDYFSAKYDCHESGNFCSDINAGGGGSGGSGSGGGGGSSCNTAGFCSAECFTCSGGGGRPSV
ncbi:MAG TPA: hypothetical protein DD490_04975 [Acidobacteria bacterium]|nr:hypothetical protein [Acidobacteriota bacterium]